MQEFRTRTSITVRDANGIKEHPGYPLITPIYMIDFCPFSKMDLGYLYLLTLELSAKVL